jgi:hypothetical protein
MKKKLIEAVLPLKELVLWKSLNDDKIHSKAWEEILTSTKEAAYGDQGSGE